MTEVPQRLLERSRAARAKAATQSDRDELRRLTRTGGDPVVGEATADFDAALRRTDPRHYPTVPRVYRLSYQLTAGGNSIDMTMHYKHLTALLASLAGVSGDHVDAIYMDGKSLTLGMTIEELDDPSEAARDETPTDVSLVGELTLRFKWDEGFSISLDLNVTPNYRDAVEVAFDGVVADMLKSFIDKRG